MIGYLEGKLIDVEADAMTLLVSGVGYEVVAPLNTICELQSQKGQIVPLHIYTHVREDALVLFGFVSKEEKSFFLNLLKVNGVGPKMAINIMSGSSVDQIRNMVEHGDVKGLSKLPKVGKKTAEQLILTLKGKLVLSSSAEATGKHKVEIISALVNLGFKQSDVEKIVQNFSPDIELHEGVKKALQLLSNQ